MAKIPAEPEHSVWGSEPDNSVPSGLDELLLGSSDSGSSKGQVVADKAGFRDPKQPSCVLKALDGLWGGAKFGLLAGAVGTALEVKEWGLRGPAAVGAVLRGAVSGAFAFGSGIGLYRGTVCGCEQIRGVQDVYNSILAGGVVGALSEVPLMLRNYLLRDIEKALSEQGRIIVKSRPRFFVNSALGAAGCGMLYLLESSSKSTRHTEQRQARAPIPIQVASESNQDLVSLSSWGVQRHEDGIHVDEGVGAHELGEFTVEPYWDSGESVTSSGD